MHGDVDVSAIPNLSGAFESLGVEKRPIGGVATKTFVVVPRELGPGQAPQLAYIAKCPAKHGPRESATEYLISCIGRLLPLQVAEGRLVRMPPPVGIRCDVRFLSRYFLPNHTQELVHGFELIATFFKMDEQELRKQVPPSRQERELFTVEFITAVLDHFAERDERVRVRLRRSFAKMMAFDALIGANDRHPKNWGLIRDILQKGSSSWSFSPVFDTSRALFWNHSDEDLRAVDERNGREDFIERYAQRSIPLICCDRPLSNPKRLNHFDVISGMMQLADSGFQRPIRQVVGSFHLTALRRLLHQRFRRLFSRRRLQYIEGLLSYRHARLKKICGVP